MTAKLLESGEEIAAWLRQNIRSDFCLSAPYRRRWHLGGCEPTHFLATWPTDRLTKLGSELHDSGFEVRASPRGVHVAAGDGGVTVAAGRTDLGDGPPPSTRCSWEQKICRPTSRTHRRCWLR